MKIFLPLMMVLTSHGTTANYILKFPACLTFVLTCGRNSVFRFFPFELLVGVCNICDINGIWLSSMFNEVLLSMMKVLGNAFMIYCERALKIDSENAL
jgi:hypothetical protein